MQSALVQQPDIGMQSCVPVQFLKPELQAMLHLPVVGSQAAEPFEVGVGQETHVVPQKLVLVSDWQRPLQLCVPIGQRPLQAFVLGMQAPAHRMLPLGHAGTQASPLQETVPPVGAWHAVQDVESVGPHVATSVFFTHLPLHR